MNLKYYIAMALLVHGFLQSQTAKGYQIATWHGFKTAALSYTFDDNCANQLPIALPLFDQYNYKTTHFTVSGWIKDWTPLNKAALEGHEIASHTVSHPHLSELSLEEQEGQLKNAQKTIEENIRGYKCETIAYPFCDIGSKTNAQKYHMAGRICLGTVESSFPKDFYEISSIPVGSQSAVVTARHLDSAVSVAKDARAWAVFLIHGVDNDGGYSPIASSDLKKHLKSVNTDSIHYWVATFAHVVKYIKERNAITLAEEIVNTNTIKLRVSDSLDNAVYNVPITLRRVLPKGWSEAFVYHEGNLVSSLLTTGFPKCIEFDVVPDKGVYTLSKKKYSK